MLSRSNSSLIPFAGILGFIGIALMGIKFVLGLSVFLVAVGMFAFAFFSVRRSDPPAPHQIIPAQTIISSPYEILEDPAGRPASMPIGNEFYQSLLTALRTQGFNLKVAVILTDGEPVTAEGIFIEIARIMQEKGDTVQAVKPILKSMYDLLWNYTDEACERYSDLELIKIHIASSVYFTAKAKQPSP